MKKIYCIAVLCFTASGIFAQTSDSTAIAANKISKENTALKSKVGLYETIIPQLIIGQKKPETAITDLYVNSLRLATENAEMRRILEQLRNLIVEIDKSKNIKEVSDVLVKYGVRDVSNNNSK